MFSCDNERREMPGADRRRCTVHAAGLSDAFALPLVFTDRVVAPSNDLCFLILSGSTDLRVISLSHTDELRLVAPAGGRASGCSPSPIMHKGNAALRMARTDCDTVAFGVFELRHKAVLAD